METLGHRKRHKLFSRSRTDKTGRKRICLENDPNHERAGGIPDFSVCVKIRKSCAKFMPQEERGQFDIKGKINNLMIFEME